MTNWTDTIIGAEYIEYCVTHQVEVYCHLCSEAYEHPDTFLGLTETGQQALDTAIAKLNTMGWGQYHDDEGDSHAVCDECLQRLKDGWNPGEGEE